MEVFLPIAQVFVNPVEILLLSAIVGVLSGLFGVGGGFLMNKDLQLDSAVTLNFKDTPSVFAVNFGISYRLDRHKDVQEINKNISAKKQRKRQSHSRKKSKKKKIGQILFGLLQKISHNISSLFTEIKQ